MTRTFLQRLRRLLPYGLALLFALQAGTVVPRHHFHGSEMRGGHGSEMRGGHESETRNGHGSEARAQSPAQAPEKSSLPDDCRCEFCLTFSALDHASVAPPPILGLVEAAFPLVGAYATFEYPSPLGFARARGPPALTA